MNILEHRGAISFGLIQFDCLLFTLVFRYHDWKVNRSSSTSPNKPSLSGRRGNEITNNFRCQNPVLDLRVNMLRAIGLLSTGYMAGI